MVSRHCEPCGGNTPHMDTICLICLTPEERTALLSKELRAVNIPPRIEMACIDGEGAESEDEMSQTPPTPTLVQAQGAVPWLNPNIIGRNNATTVDSKHNENAGRGSSPTLF